MSADMFENEMMGPERAANKAFAAEQLGGESADYDAFSRRGSFLDHDVDDEPMRRGSISPDADPFIARRPSQAVPAALDSGQADADVDDEPAFTPRDGRINSMRRPGATSLEPMAFGRARAGTETGLMTAPWSPNIHRDPQLEEDNQASIDQLLKENPGERRGPYDRGLLRARMNGNNALFGQLQSPERAPHTQDELQDMGSQMDYQHDASDRNQRNLDPARHWQFWTQAHPKRPNQGAFMSEPDAGWDRVQSRGFLGLPYLFSKLGSTLFGTKGGRYERRQADLARRNGTFDRAWETYGSTDEGRKGVMPDWIKKSKWARNRWQAKSR